MHMTVCLPKAFTTRGLITHKISSIPPLVHTPKTLNVYGATSEAAFRALDDHKNVVGYLAEFLFKRKFPDHRDRIHAFFTAVAELYPPSR